MPTLELLYVGFLQPLHMQSDAHANKHFCQEQMRR